MMDLLGPALRVLRERTGLSQRALAQRCRNGLADCNITQAMLSQWERGAQRPTLPSLLQVLTGLGFDLSDLQRAIDGLAPSVAKRVLGQWVVDFTRDLERLDKRIGRVEAQLTQLQADSAAARNHRQGHRPRQRAREKA